MAIEDLAASAVRSISKRKGKKLHKKGPAAPIEDVMPTNLKAPEGEKFRVGYAMREVMPADVHAKKYWIAGHGPGKRITGVHDPITVSAMWIGCGEAGGIVMLSADVVGITNVEVRGVRDSLADFVKESNCINISISCTHSHAGIDSLGYWGKLPKTGKDPEYMEMLYKALHDVAIEAYENRKDGSLYVGTIHVPDAQYDKRPPVVLHDVLTRIRFVPEDGSDETWFLNFAAHPNTLGGSNYDISADYPYYMRETIKAKKNVNVLFGIGAIGAVDPGMYSEDKHERTRMQGEALGNAAWEIDNDKELAPDITVLCQQYDAPVDNGVLAFLGILKVMCTSMQPCDKGDLGLALRSEMTYIRIGSLQILQLPGEMFPELAYGGYASAEESATGKGPEINPTPIVDIAGDKELLIFGITNDMAGYMVAPNDYVLNPTQAYLNNGRDRFDRSHYHETNSLGYLTAETVANTFTHIMEKVNAAK